MCSIAYEPCNEHSFRIGSNQPRDVSYPNQFNPYSSYNGAPSYYQPNPYQTNPYQTNPYYPNPAPMIAPNGMLMPNPYATNGALPPNRIVYDANGSPAILSPNGMLTPINSNALTGKVTSQTLKF